MNFDDVIENWKAYATAIENLGGDVRTCSVDEPAAEKDILKLEQKLGLVLPSSLKEVLLNFSKKVEFSWFLPDKFELEGDLSGIFSGERHWSLDWIVQFDEAKKRWIEKVFPNKEDPYDVVWHNKLAFGEVGNGDYLAIDLSSPDKEPVVYLSHDGGDGHGVEISRNFKEFVFSSSRLGCVGSEDWQWLPFVEDGKPYINPDCENANKFREALGVTA